MERINQTILNMLATVVKDHKSLGVTFKNNMYGMQLKYPVNHRTVPFLPDVLWIHNFLENVYLEHVSQAIIHATTVKLVIAPYHLK